jgi:hypothetical protein
MGTQRFAVDSHDTNYQGWIAWHVTLVSQSLGDEPRGTYKRQRSF